MKKTNCSSMNGLMLRGIVCLLLTGPVTRADFTYSEPTLVPNVNSANSDGSPYISRDGLELYFNSAAEGECSDMWVSKRSTTEDSWSVPTKLEGSIHSPGTEYAASYSADGLTLYFSEGYESASGCAPRAEGYGHTDLWVSTRASKNHPWGIPKNLGPTVNSNNVEDSPCISTDGLSVYFVSDRGGLGGSDVYVTNRQSKDDPWGEPVNLGSNVNSDAYEYAVFISPDSLSLFISRGWSQPKVFVCRRRTSTDPWGPAEFFAPVNSGTYLGGNPNGTATAGLTFSEEDSTVYFGRGTSVHSTNWNIWQVEVTPILDLNEDGAVNKSDVNELRDHWGTRNALYDIAPIPCGDSMVDAKDLLVLGRHLSVVATDPHPANRERNIPHNTALSWEPSEFAQMHDVYLGTVYDEVSNATKADSSYIGRQEAISCQLGPLEFSKTYYWRVDEISDAPDFIAIRGDIWSFTTEPFSNPIENIIATASSSHAESMEPEKTVDGSGLDALQQHSTQATDMWLSGVGDPTPWIQYEFDKVYKLDHLSVWNSNQLIESFLGLGAKGVVIETSVDGAEWTVLEGTTLFNQATGTADYAANTSIDLAGVMAQHVKITINTGYGMMPQYGISEVRFFSIPVRARQAVPASGKTMEGVDVVLKWHTGREAVSHQVHFSPDSAAITDAAALVGVTNTPSFDLSAQGLELGTTYYWRIDEVNEAANPSIYVGDLWSFSTPNYLTVDDLDQYNDTCNRIFFAWEDGLGHNGGADVAGCNMTPSDGNGGGSVVGHNQAPFAEKTITNVDSLQSMPLIYDNSMGQSETTLLLASQDWTTSGVQTLSLFFFGQPDNSGQLYVKINDTKLIYNGDGADLTQERWRQWDIDLTTLEGLQNVTTLTIGVDGDTAAGMLYIDDIRLYP